MLTFFSTKTYFSLLVLINFWQQIKEHTEGFFLSLAKFRPSAVHLTCLVKHFKFCDIKSHYLLME